MKTIRFTTSHRFIEVLMVLYFFINLNDPSLIRILHFNHKLLSNKNNLFQVLVKVPLYYLQEH